MKTRCASLLLLLLSCTSEADVPGDGGPADRAPIAAPAAPVEASARSAAAPARANGPQPVYVFLFTHHYRGLGGYYPSAQQVRDVAEACVEADLADMCTLFFDGLLVDRLADEDPKLDDYVRQHGFPLGYHGEEAHGPYPVVVSVSGLNQGKAKSEEGCVQGGSSFDQAVDTIHSRYTHGFSGVQLDSSGYISRNSGGTSAGSKGGIAAVEAWAGGQVTTMPGHNLFQPAATMAFAREADIKFLQAAGPLAPHFLAASKNYALQEVVGSFLGQQDTLFWYMGQLAEKGSSPSMFPMWNKASLVEKEGGKGGGGKAAGGSDGSKGGKGARGGGGKKPPKNADGSWPSRDGSDSSGGSNKEIKQQMLALESGSDGSAGAEVRAAAAALDRSRPVVVSMKIDGSKQDVAATLSFMKQWQAEDEGVVLVNPSSLAQLVGSSKLELGAKDAAKAVLAAWSGGPSDSLEISGVPVSQADAFEVMARQLAGSGDRVTTTDVLGPIGSASTLAQATGKVSVDDVRAAAASVVAAIDGSPHHAMPVNVVVGGQQVGFHQYHWLMAKVIDGASKKLSLPDAGYAAPFAKYLADGLGRTDPDAAFWMECQYWTIKPATWR